MFSCKQLLLCGNNLSHCIIISQSASLTNFTIQSGSNGVSYVKFANGLILAWGSKTVSSDSTAKTSNSIPHTGYAGRTSFKHGVPFTQVLYCNGRPNNGYQYPNEIEGFAYADTTWVNLSLIVDVPSAERTMNFFIVGI